MVEQGPPRSLFDATPRQLDRVAQRQRPSARAQNDLIDSVNKLRSKAAMPQQVFRNPRIASASGALVKINKAIAIRADAVSEEEVSNWDKLVAAYGDGAHLSCVAVDKDGNPETALIAVDPLFPQTVSDFKAPDGTQIFSAADPDDPWLPIGGGNRGLPVLMWGAGEVWVAAPAPGELCA